MENLANKKCVPCEEGGKALSKDEAEKLLHEIKGWTLSANHKNISKNLHFKDFKSALGFVNEVGDVAEFEGHHPDMNIHNWNQVTITLSTHAVKGLSKNDFIMAAKIDKTLEESIE
jgi:4a-hydroxytetrahydrobiopterin dehydratase